MLTVYNVEVEDHHTYFVTGEGWRFSVWAHNAGYPPNGEAKRLQGPLDPSVKADRAAHFRQLRDERRRMGLPRAGSDGDKATLAVVQMGGITFDIGYNASLQNPRARIKFAVNGQSAKHAEANSVQNAINGGAVGTGTTANIYVDRLGCGQCGYPGNQFRAMAKALGVQELVVHVPGYAPTVFTPSN